MSGLLYRAVIAVSRLVGLWFVSAFAWVVASGYFLFFPKRVAVGLRFFRAAFPESSFWRRMWLVWCQFHQFAGTFAERLRLDRGDRFEVGVEGLEHFQKAAEAGQGGVLLMSHLGSWEVAARLLRRQGVRLMLFMGARAGEKVERQQKGSLAADGVEVVLTSAEGEGPFDTLEGLRFVRSGGFVSFAGDRLWSEWQRAVDIEFFGQRVEVPAGPHLFALVCRAPLFCIFSVRLARRRYRLLFQPVAVDAGAPREAALQQSAQGYGQLLEQMVRVYPASWYHFETFLKP